MNSSGATICIAGKNSIAVEALLYLLGYGYSDRLIVCSNKTDAGMSSWQPSLVRFAKEYQVPLVDVDQLYSIDNLLLISLEFDRILNPNKFSTDRLFNIHFSALPSFKGMYTSALPILFGCRTSGVTLHKIDRGIDTGPIVDQILFEIPERFTSRDLYYSYIENALILFKRNIHSLIRDGDNILSTPQSAIGSTYFSKHSIDWSNVRIRLNDTADSIVRQVRAFSFREYQTPKVDGLAVCEWEILSSRSDKKPGSVIFRDADSVVVSTIDYDLRLIRDKSWDWFNFSEMRSAYDMRTPDKRFINVRDMHGCTPLIKAVHDGRAQLCRALLQCGADPNVGDANGATPLMYAFMGPLKDHREKVISELLACGADVERRDYFGKALGDYGFSV